MTSYTDETSGATVAAFVPALFGRIGEVLRGDVGAGLGQMLRRVGCHSDSGRV